jgi:hypothetical protein
MWWLSLAALAVSLVIYVVSALHVFNFGPIAEKRRAAPTDLGLASPGPTAAMARASEMARRERDGVTIQLRPADSTSAESIDVPVPPGIEAPSHGRGQSDRVTLTIPGDLRSVLDFYRDALEHRGWHEVWSRASLPTDTMEHPTTAFSAFCKNADGPAILVAIMSADDTASRLQIRVVEARGEICGPNPVDPSEGSPPLIS